VSPSCGPEPKSRQASPGRQPALVSGSQLAVQIVPGALGFARSTQAPPGEEQSAEVEHVFSHCWPPPSTPGAQASPAAQLAVWVQA
jgi:hypothetical protein